MFLSNLLLTKLSVQAFWLAQVPIDTSLEPTAAENAALVFSGPQFFTALISGVLLAFGFQLLLTNLGIATWFSLLGSPSSNSELQPHSESKSFGGSVRKISFYIGLGTLITVSIVLFLASLCAVKLSLLASPLSGGIVGLVIWATYLSLLIWFGSTRIGSLVGSVVSTATSGFQALLSTASTVIGGKALNQQVVNTAEAAAAAVRRELGAGLDPVSLKENVQDYLESLRSQELDWNKIRSDFESLLSDPNLQEVVSKDSLQNIDRQTFVDLISNRSDLSKREVNRLADQLEMVWNKTLKQSQKEDPFTEFTSYFKLATPEQLSGNELTQKLNQFVKELSNSKDSDSSGIVSQAVKFGLKSLIGIVVERTDLSDLDVEKITGQFQKLKGKLGEQKDKLLTQGNTDKPFSSIKIDVENYLHNAHPWQLSRENLYREFRDLLYDPQADAGVIQYELEQIDRADFTKLLQEKGILTQTKIYVIADLLEEIRQECLSIAIELQEQEKEIALQAKVEHYLMNTPKEDLTADKVQINFKPILEDSDADFEQLNARLTKLDRLTFEHLLSQREDFLPVEASIYTNELEIAKEQILIEAQDLQAALKAKVEQQWLKVQAYLRDTGKEELNPESIQQELKLLTDDFDAGTAALKTRISHFDRDTLVQLLSQRNDITEEQAEQITSEIETTWSRIRYAPKYLVDSAKHKYEDFTSAISDYLRSTGKEELNPEGINRDLTILLADPKVGTQAIKQRLAALDRDTLVKLLSQRKDLSEAQVNQTIDQVLDKVRSVVKAPRRLARRTQEKAQEFQGMIANYLRSTDKEELNPEGIQRDIQLLLNDPRGGIENLKDRLSHFDRDTLVAFLSQREDISEKDVERIIDQILVVREQFLEKIQSVQHRIQTTIDGIFAKIRDYLNGLDRPELNYDGIKHDLRTVFADPEAGFEALRDRFSHIDRDTLMSILSSRDDISQADAERIISQIESSRDRLLHRAERIQQQAQLRLEQVKQETQQRMEETRKTAAIASWWLFFISLISAFASAGGGSLGVLV